MLNNEQLRRFETNLQQELLRVATSCGMLDRVLLATDDIDEHWKELAPHYVADAVSQIADYPTVSVAWAGFLGMAVAHGWDQDWSHWKSLEYTDYYGPNGFDDMDEYILYDILALLEDGYEAKELENTLRSCGEKTVMLIRHENIEPQSPMAFHIFSRACKVMYRIGAAIELKRMGYKFEEIPCKI